MKIALMIYQFIKVKGGVEGYVCNLSEQLLKRNFEVHVFAHRFSQNHNRNLIYHYVPSVKFWSPLKYWSFAINAPKTVKKTGINFDVIHGFTQTFYQDIYRVGGGCHWVYMVNTYPLMQSTMGRIFLCLNPRHFGLLLLEKFIFRKKCYKQIICVSEQCKKEIIHRYKLSENQIDVIYNGVDIEIFTPQNRLKYRDMIRNKYAIGEEEIVLLFVGSGFKRKGLRYIIEAFSMLDKNSNIKLLVAGRGGTRGYLRLAKRRGIDDKLIFVGLYKEIQQIYAAGDIFVFPSEYDPFSNASLEAMASGLSVIVSKTSGISELVAHGKDGFIIQHPINVEEIAKYITVLLKKEKRDSIGLMARKKAEEYSLQAHVEKLLHIYKIFRD